MIKVSVIVPVYNVEQYLNKCMDSIIGQSCQELEIICVDDGSTDKSAAILDQYAQKDERIKVIHKSNSGYGDSVNIGIKAARGEYLAIVESDDYILPKMYERLHQTAKEQDADIVKADFYQFQNSEKKEYRRYYQFTQKKNYNCIISPMKELTEFFYTHTWSGIYRASYITNNHILHNETAGASYQDVGFWIQSLIYTDRAYYIDEPFYMYRQDNALSSSNSTGKLMAYTEEFKYIRNRLENYTDNNKQFLLEFCSACELDNNVRRLQDVSADLRMSLCKVITKNLKEALYRKDLNLDRISGEVVKKLLLISIQPECVCEEIDKQKNSRHKWDIYIDKFQQIILYGAGIYALKMADYLLGEHLWNRSIICAVTHKDQKEYDKTLPDEIYEIDDIGFESRKEALLILCSKMNTTNYSEMHQKSVENGFVNILSADEILSGLN